MARAAVPFGPPAPSTARAPPGRSAYARALGAHALRLAPRECGPLGGYLPRRIESPAQRGQRPLDCAGVCRQAGLDRRNGSCEVAQRADGLVVQLLAHGFSDGAQRRGGAIPGRIELGFGIRRLLRGSLVLVPAGSEVLLRAPQLAPGFVRVATRLLLAGEQSCVLACPQGPQRVFRRSNSGGRT